MKSNKLMKIVKYLIITFIILCLIDGLFAIGLSLGFLDGFTIFDAIMAWGGLIVPYAVALIALGIESNAYSKVNEELEKSIKKEM